MAEPDDGTYLRFDRDSTRGRVYARFNAEPRIGACHSCAHLRSGVSLWCTNPEAVKSYGTAIPQPRHCTFWETPPSDGPPLVPVLRLLLGGGAG